MVICNGKQVQFHLAEKGPGEPPAKHCRKKSVLPETRGAGAATLCFLSVPLLSLKCLFPKEIFPQGKLQDKWQYCLLLSAWRN